jgi:hypothetical protein
MISIHSEASRYIRDRKLFQLVRDLRDLLDLYDIEITDVDLVHPYLVVRVDRFTREAYDGTDGFLQRVYPDYAESLVVASKV